MVATSRRPNKPKLPVKKRPTKAASRKAASTSAAGAVQVSAWENDPFSQAVPTDPPLLATPILRPAPVLSPTDPLPIKIDTPPPKPAGQFSPGTAEFRYWTAAEALRRAGDFWNKIAGVTKWFRSVGKILPVTLDAGVDFNAFYDRHELEFFHGSVAGFGTVFSGESPDIVCHELGHAILDTLRPPLFNAGFIEVAAFHESFGDMSAILSALQLQPVRLHVLAETHGNLSRSSSLSRLAEQLGFAIRKINAAAVERDCLRNAANSFFYRDPSTLPPSAPASALSSEPHSFSRVFTGAFLDVLAGLLNVRVARNIPTEADLLQVSEKAANYLVKAIGSAPVIPAYYSQIAAAMVNAADPSDKNAVAGGFVHHGILSLPAAAAAVARKTTMTAVMRKAGKGRDDLDKIAIPAAEYGFLAESVLVNGASEEGDRYDVTGAAFAAGSLPTVPSDRGAKDFLEDLLQLGRVEFGKKRVGVAAFGSPFAQPSKRKTHKLVKDGQAVRLVRLGFDCGFDCGCCGPYILITKDYDKKAKGDQGFSEKNFGTESYD